MSKQITVKNQTEFLIWMDKVDLECQKVGGVSIYDLADQPFSDMFEDGFGPKKAAKLALSSEGFDEPKYCDDRGFHDDGDGNGYDE